VGENDFELSIPPFLGLHSKFNVKLLQPYFPPLLDTSVMIGHPLAEHPTLSGRQSMVVSSSWQVAHYLMEELDAMETIASYGERNDLGGNRWPLTYSTSSNYNFHIGKFSTVFWVPNFRGCFEALNGVFLTWQSPLDFFLMFWDIQNMYFSVRPF
jgi:hypothetical protein